MEECLDHPDGRAVRYRLSDETAYPREALAALDSPVADLFRLEKSADWSEWGEGRVTLLGDAAHPMTPNLGQGACQAIEDAVVLADCLRGASDLVEALRRYEARRIPRANSFVLGSLRLGRLAQWENAAARWLRNRALALVPATVTRRQLVRSLAFEMPKTASSGEEPR